MGSNLELNDIKLEFIKLQETIIATRLNAYKKLLRSLDAKLMAIKQVTTLNNVRKIKIPRVGKKIFTDNEKSKLVQKLRLDGKVFTIKSVYFGKPEKKNKRLLPGSISVLSN